MAQQQQTVVTRPRFSPLRRLGADPLNPRAPFAIRDAVEWSLAVLSCLAWVLFATLVGRP